jgi:hypothetical protein
MKINSSPILATLLHLNNLMHAYTFCIQIGKHDYANTEWKFGQKYEIDMTISNTSKNKQITRRGGENKRVMGITNYSCEGEHMLLTLKWKEQLKPYLCHPLGAALYQLHSIWSNFAGARKSE